jgi:uncharacterized protein YndB with AHSA1/START domain
VQLSLILLAVLSVQQAAVVQLPDAMIAPTCVACRIDVEKIRGGYSDGDWNALAGGETITTETKGVGSEKGDVLAAGIIRGSPQQVWTVLTEFERRPEFIAATKDVRVLQVDGNRVWIAEHLRVLLVNVRYSLINTLDPESGLMSWVLDKSVPHDIADTTGAWQLVPLAGGAQTLVTYRAWIDTGRPVPGFIESFLVKRSLPQVINGLRDQVQRQFGTLGRP